MTDDVGVVFVLVPGGRFLMGAQREDPRRPNHSPGAYPDEIPVHEVTLSPFFLSKYEMTQGQWLRLTGSYPSSNSFLNWSPSMSESAFTLRNPVEGVSWNEGRVLLERIGFRYPTEAEWEYAARAGTRTPWYSGSEVSTIEGHGNLADQWFASLEVGQESSAVSWNDGWGVHAPVGIFVPNPFGLHDVIGNVSEWCQDSYSTRYLRVEMEASCVDPIVPPELAGNHVIRGSSYRDGSTPAQSAHRRAAEEHLGYEYVGIRPARSIE